MKQCMNFKFVILFALTLLVGSTVYGQDNVIDEVVWVVGDEAILKSEVEEARMSALYEGRKFDRDPYCVIPEEIAVQKLYLHQAALDSIEVSESGYPACGLYDEHVHRQHRFARENGGILQQDFQPDS
jgi:peptidyl-prolyl cis-trans isomerase SurA